MHLSRSVIRMHTATPLRGCLRHDQGRIAQPPVQLRDPRRAGPAARRRDGKRASRRLPAAYDAELAGSARICPAKSSGPDGGAGTHRSAVMRGSRLSIWRTMRTWSPSGRLGRCVVPAASDSCVPRVVALGEQDHRWNDRDPPAAPSALTLPWARRWSSSTMSNSRIKSRAAALGRWWPDGRHILVPKPRQQEAGEGVSSATTRT